MRVQAEGPGEWIQKAESLMPGATHCVSFPARAGDRDRIVSPAF